MPVFDTPEPISVTIDLYAGYVQLIASDRTDTVVEVRPANASDESDVEAAAATRVDCTDGVLTVRGPKRTFDFSKKSKTVDVVVELPAGSQAHVDVTAGGIRGTGLLGECRVKTSMGRIHLDRTGALRADTSAGDITVGETGGDTEIHTGTGQIRLGDIGGAAVVKNSNGHTELGAVAGDLKVRAANGNITVARAGRNVEAKSANGHIGIGEVVRGEVGLNSSMGTLEIGIAAGTAAWLDVKTAFGRVNNELDASQGPEQADNTVKVTAHTSTGDITIRRA
ncbi:DUF4097 family beta strand repeat protein [Lentzea tibetensis]|uniref:DUF4097 family beta strand repeat protein n=1 Tax=Lentzea tibetensis TaxID=2591470 RepID=A0A563EMZ8_9PSEU|nr:DUF4097 family beta strand repeat-containing protein [Lentzea tibetensis]TWP47984.1 DUF4097 family beta strand repeat protein [Lentzea tibetensis]